MKGIYNGCLNMSILDGWWAEGYAPEVGWAIGAGEEYAEADWEDQDRIEGNAIYHILENDIMPRFYTRGRDGLPREWIAMMKNGIRDMAPFFNTNRMVQQYTDQFYMENFYRIQSMLTDNMRNGRDYANWRRELENIWNRVDVMTVEIDKNTAKVGSKAEVVAKVHLGSLSPDNVKVQLYYGSLDTRGDIVDGNAQNMDVAENNGDGVYTFKTTHQYQHAGDIGISVRVVPYHEYMHTVFQPKLITWA
jgi:starch phosphorylase